MNNENPGLKIFKWSSESLIIKYYAQCTGLNRNYELRLRKKYSKLRPKSDANDVFLHELQYNCSTILPCHQSIQSIF